MFSRTPSRPGSMSGFGMTGGPVAPDVLALLAVVFATFSLQFFSLTAPLIGLLRLTPAVWQQAFVWQVATYPFVGSGGPSIWFLIELLILFLFARDVFNRLSRRSFWRLMVWGTLTAAGVAIVVELVTPGASPAAFALLQGQRTLLVIVIAAFATLYRSATIYLFFVLPIKARWFLWLEVLFAFMGFLGSGDLAGFLGITAAVAMTYNILSGGGLRRVVREGWLRLEQRRIKAQLGRMRRQRGMRIVKDDEKSEDSDRWVN